VWVNACKWQKRLYFVSNSVVMRYISIFCLAFALALTTSAQQQTVGLFHYDVSSSTGYNLFAPFNGTTTYLINNCGREIRQWPGDYNPGASAYLQTDGILLRTARISSNVFNGGGIGGRLERLDWNAVEVWSYQYATATVHQHHDIEPLPNGNILVVAWETKTSAEAIAAGRDPATLGAELWPDHIAELEPVGTNGANIVWEWHAWDHLIQDFDASKANFGVVGDHQELIDVNQGGASTGQRDWLHVNAVAYHSGLDQIVLSVHHMNELWVIDHSTTTAEAASHSGGNSGKGGDLLYRWGNPLNYDRGTAADQKLFGQHNVQWIPDSLPGGGSLMVFNNGLARPAGEFSSVEVIAPPAIDSLGNYSLSPGQAYGPAAPSWIYTAPDPEDFYSANISGASRMPNGNTLICNGAEGRFFEVDPSGDVVWDYINPIAFDNPVAQGDIPSGNFAFRVERYAPSYPGLQGKSLSPGQPLELNPLPIPAACNPISATDSSLSDWDLGPVPFDLELKVRNPLHKAASLRVWNMDGRLVLEMAAKPGDNLLETSTWPAGVYLLKVDGYPGAVKLLKF
jgi:hypothetical protein